MKKQLMYQAIIALLSFSAFGQIDGSEIGSNETTVAKSSIAAASNKSITLCNIAADTLTFDQISSCNELIISGETTRKILSYNLIIIYPDGTTIHEYFGKGNEIPENVIERIISSGTKKIFFEKVHVTDGTEKKDIGYRAYNFR